MVGRKSGAMIDMELFENEAITQVSGVSDTDITRFYGSTFENHLF